MRASIGGPPVSRNIMVMTIVTISMSAARVISRMVNALEAVVGRAAAAVAGPAGAGACAGSGLRDGAAGAEAN
jgi:hypothetical protein